MLQVLADIVIKSKKTMQLIFLNPIKIPKIYSQFSYDILAYLNTY